MKEKNDLRMLGISVERSLIKELRALAFYRETSQAEIVRTIIADEIARARAAGEFKPREAAA